MYVRVNVAVDVTVGVTPVAESECVWLTVEEGEGDCERVRVSVVVAVGEKVPLCVDEYV